MQKSISKYCVIRDCQRMVLLTQWQKWEEGQDKRIAAGLRHTGAYLTEISPGSVILDKDFKKVSEKAKIEVARLCALSLAACHPPPGTQSQALR